MDKTNDSAPRGSTPVPDPTILTTQQLYREIAASREIIEANIGKIEVRLDAMDIATKLNKEATDRIPSMVKCSVSELEKLHNEKFSGVEKQFAERDDRTSQVSELNQKALDAALQAAKEAAGKTELSFTKQISDLTEQFNTQNKAMDVRVNDIKSRLDLGEGTTGGGHTTKQESKAQINQVISWLVALGAIAIAVISIIAR